MDALVNLKREALDYSPVHNNTVLIDLRTAWGNNPFRVGRDGDRQQVIAKYRAGLWRRIPTGEVALEELAELDGCWLACWCEPLPCHGHVLARAAAWASRVLAERAALYGATPERSEFDTRDFIRARKDRKTETHLPSGTLVAIVGGKDIANPAAVIARLDKAREKYSDLVLVHGGGAGVERIAASWAERNGVHQIVCKPDWNKHGRAAPFRRNDELLNLLPKGVIAFPGSGITDNLVDKARQLGIPVLKAVA